jgi:hypothetical protein
MGLSISGFDNRVGKTTVKRLSKEGTLVEKTIEDNVASISTHETKNLS